MRIHTDERPYKCERFTKAFREKAKLAIHRRIHTGERPFSCGECGRAFAHANSLATHKRIHNGERPYQCKECGLKFAQLAPFNYHKTTHTGEKPFKCDLAGGYFAANVVSASTFTLIPAKGRSNAASAVVVLRSRQAWQLIREFIRGKSRTSAKNVDGASLNCPPLTTTKRPTREKSPLNAIGVGRSFTAKFVSASLCGGVL